MSISSANLTRSVSAPAATSRATKENTQAKVDVVEERLHSGIASLRDKADEATLQGKTLANQALARLPPPVAGRILCQVSMLVGIAVNLAPKEHPMGIAEKISNKVQELTGKVKEGVGKATDNEHLEAEGKADQVKSNLKQVGEEVKDSFQD